MNNKGNEVEVISSEQAQVIEVAQKYSAGFKASVTHTKGYALLFGTALNQLKEITPHGGFIALQERTFPEYGRAWLNRLMQFAEAKKLKCLVTGHLKNGQLLLALPESEKAELFDQVEEITGNKSIEQIALEVAKKKQKEKNPPQPLTEEEKIAAEDAQALAFYEAAYQAQLALHDLAKVIHLRVPAKQRDVLYAANVKTNKILKALGRKAARALAPVSK